MEFSIEETAAYRAARGIREQARQVTSTCPLLEQAGESNAC
jgi:hypothetical protein